MCLEKKLAAVVVVTARVKVIALHCIKDEEE